MSKGKARIDRSPIVPERVRSISGQGFAFIPHQFLRHGFFAALSPDELLLYFLLVLVGNRYGVSFYGQDRLGSLLPMPWHTYLDARNGWIDKDLLDLIRHGRRHGHKPRTINRRLTTARLLYRFCFGKDIPRGLRTSTAAPYYRGPGKDRILGLRSVGKPRRVRLRVTVPQTLVEPLT